MFDCLFVGINYYTGFNLHGTLKSLESVHLPWTGNIFSIEQESKNIINYLVFSLMLNNKIFYWFPHTLKIKPTLYQFFQLRPVMTMHIWKNESFSKVLSLQETEKYWCHKLKSSSYNVFLKISNSKLSKHFIINNYYYYYYTTWEISAIWLA